MPPDLVELGDRLEAAAERHIARRRTRRQLALNAAASLIVAVPITLTVATTQFTTTTVPVTPITTSTPTATTKLVPDVLPSGLSNRDLIAAEDDSPSSETYLPRDLRRLRLKPSSELLLAPSALRPALR